MTTIGPSAATATTTPRRVKVPRRTLFDYLLDLVLLVAFTLDYSFRFTGLSVHEWIGFVFVVTIPVHLTQHWDWVVRTSRRLAQRRFGRESLRWLIDLLLMPAMTLCVASGLLISRAALPALGLHPGSDRFWTGLHTTTADVTVALVALHVALSWRWAWSVSRRVVLRRASGRVAA